MIPKIIHHCWFGPNPLPPEFQAYIDSAKRAMPDWKFVLWGNSDLPDNRFVRECFKWKKFALLSDYVRLFAIERDGGVYLDTDIEVYKPFDDLLDNACFLAFEKDGNEPKPLSNAFMGAIPGHPFITECLDILTWELNHRLKPFYGVKIANRLLAKKGVTFAEARMLGDIRILDRKTAFEDYCHHYYAGSWHNPHTLNSHLKGFAYRMSRAMSILRGTLTCTQSYPG